MHRDKLCAKAYKQKDSAGTVSSKESVSCASSAPVLTEEKPEIVPLSVSCSQRPDWSCGPCKAMPLKNLGN